MARFKRRAKARASGMRFGRKSRSRSSSSGSGSLTNVVLGGAIYGAGRTYASNLIQPISSKLPLGGYADNVVMGVVSWALAKGKIPFLNKIPMSKEIGKAGLYVESALIGQEAVNGFSGSTQTNTGTW